MLPRTLEPEVMDTLAEAVDYDAMDHREVNRLFADEFLEFLDAGAARTGAAAAADLRVLDVGTGTARIPIEICQRRSGLRITGIDLAAHMLQLAQRNIIEAGLAHAIRVEQVDAKALPFGDAHFDAVISNSILHHIPQPIGVFREMVRVTRPGGVLFVRDLLRPPDAEIIATILAKHAGGTTEHQRQMFENSLHAALTLEETGALLHEAGLPAGWARQSSDRHWTIAGRLAGSTSAQAPRPT